MGKKILSQVQQKKQFNSLVKVLRPKVYITDSSSFKSLVQELTGNGRTVSELPSPSSSSLPQIVEKLVPVIEVEEDDPGNPESSMESSFNASSLESFQVCNNLALSGSTAAINQGYVPNLPFDDTNSSEYVFMNQQEDSLVYDDLQALLLDVDELCRPSSFNVYSQIQQEVSIYDYELSGLI